VLDQGDEAYDDPDRMARRYRLRHGLGGKRAAILDAALLTIADVGYEQTSIAQLHRLARVSTGTIYHHFGSKRGIALELARREWPPWYRAIAAAAATKGWGGAAHRQLTWAEARPVEARFLLVEAPPLAELARVHDHWNELIADALGLGDEPDAALAALLGPGRELLRRRLRPRGSIREGSRLAVALHNAGAFGSSRRGSGSRSAVRPPAGGTGRASRP
jgi:AcrR family transcriptional regulator